MIKIIVACGRNGVIGFNNQMPWHLPRDLKFFKEKTLNQTVIMGRKTYESIGKALPQRNNIILSRQNLSVPNAEVIYSREEALIRAESFQTDIFIIGGAEIYRQFLSLANVVFKTEIQAEFVGDAHFPRLSEALWTEVSRDFYPADEKNAYDLAFVEYHRRSA